ncbi:MAG: hypothetical protein JJE52_15980 [Acidimicrobiia bacterium]|nr:hypothetical protein [Acidimicrobiia bacterium]
MRILRLDLEDGEELDLHPYVTVLGGLAPRAHRRAAERLVRIARGDVEGLSGLVEAQDLMIDIAPPAVNALGLPPDTDLVVHAEQLPGAHLVGSPSDDSAEVALRSQAAAAAELERIELELVAAAARVAAATTELDDARRGLDDFAVTAHDDAVSRAAAAEAEVASSLDGAPPDLSPSEQRARLVEQFTAVRGAAVDLEAELDLERLALLEMLEELEARRVALDEMRAGPDGDTPDAPSDPVVEPEPAAPAVPSTETVADVTQALDLVRVGPPAAEMVASPEALALASEIAAHHQRHDELEAALRDEGIDLVSLEQQLADTRAAITSAEADSRPKVVSPADDAEIERLHDIVVEQGEKRSSRRGGKNAELAHHEASEALGTLLESLGYPTYVAYVMGRIAPTIDPDARRRLQDATERAAELQAELAQAAAQLEHDARVLVLRAERDQLHVAARDLLGTLPDDVEGALRARRVPAPVHNVALDELAALLHRVGAEVVSIDEAAIIGTAEGFLADASLARADAEASTIDRTAEPATTEPPSPTQAAEQEIARLRRVAAEADAALAEREAELADRTEQVARLDADVAEHDARHTPDDPGADHGSTIDPRVDRDPRVIEAAEIVAATEARLARHHIAAEQVDMRHAALRQARQAERDATSARDAALVVVAQVAEVLAQIDADRPLPDVEWKLDDDGVEPIEWYLLGRVASLRKVSHAGSVPLVLDDAFRGLPDEHVRSLCAALARIGETVQVVYLGSDSGVAAWAADQDLAIAALVRPGEPAI